MIKFLLFTCISLVPAVQPFGKEEAHAIYISVLELNQTTKTLTIKVFANDFSDVLFNLSNQRVNLLKEDCQQYQELIQQYFNSHLVIKVDGTILQPVLQSCEINDTSIWLHFAFSTADTWKKLELKADYLMELFPTQSNIVNLMYKEEKKMFRLTKGAAKINVSL